MPLHRGRTGGTPLHAALASAALLACLLAPPAYALRIVTYNLHQYPSDLGNRQQPLRTVMGAINADIVIAQEIDQFAGRDSFLTNVLNVVEPGQWSATPWFNLFGAEGGAIFYKTAKVSLSNVSTFSTSGPRDVLYATVTPAGYAAAAATFLLYSIHFKAGGPGCTATPCESTTRRLECTDIRNTLNNLPAGTNFVLGGDTNFYSALEGGYIRLTESQLDNDGRLKDPQAPYLTAAWHANSGISLFHTQCPCKTVAEGGLGCLTGYSGGGMDDRFDILLTSYSMQDGQGLDYYPASPVFNQYAYPYQFGNDGSHYNKDINASPPNTSVTTAVANALHDASDHLPVVITIQLPAKVVASTPIDFGQAILGGSPTQNLSVSNGATSPADALSYTLTAPTDFTAPGGSFEAPAGAGPNLHALGMSTASIGAKSGTLTVNSDDPDTPTANVSLTGTVLDHAASSLDSSAVVVGATLDFGDHAAGSFTDQAFRVHDYGYDPLQARLSVSAANITGGDAGRFSIVGGFTPALLGGTGQTWNVHFDDTGATPDQVYTATLTLTCADEPLPGAAAASDLTISLRAKPLTPVGVGDRPVPKTLAFFPPRPNPIASEVEFSFDLPAEAGTSLAIYDLSGRRVASLVSGSLPADHYQRRWDLRGDDGARVHAGLYFARFVTRGMHRTARLVVLP